MDTRPKERLLKILSQRGTQALILLKESMNPNGIFPEGIWPGWGGGWGGKPSKTFPSMEVGLDVFWNNATV